MQVVTTHMNSDFDALASVIGATLLYPNSVGVIPTSVNNNVAKFLSTHKTAFNIILPSEVKFAEVTVIKYGYRISVGPARLRRWICSNVRFKFIESMFSSN